MAVSALFALLFIGSYAATYNFIVYCGPACESLGSRSYYINGALDPALSCYPGDILNFYLSPTNLSSHPFAIFPDNVGGAALYPANTNVSLVCNASWMTTPLYYRCTIHPDMTGTITALPAPTPTPTPTPVPAPSAPPVSVTSSCQEFTYICGANKKIVFSSATLDTSVPCGASVGCSNSTDVLSYIQSVCTTHYCHLTNLSAASFGIPDACPGAPRVLNVGLNCVTVQTPITSTLTNFANRLNFLVLGDWGGNNDAAPTTPIQIAVAAQMVTIGTARNISFVLGLGDNFYDMGVSDPNSTRFTTTWLNVYNRPPLSTVDWYIIAGNHDHYASTAARTEVEYSTLGYGGGRWKFPSLNYEVVFPIPNTNRTFLLSTFDSFDLTTEAHQRPPNATLAAETQAYLALVGGRGYSHWRMVATHYPFYSVSTHGTNLEIIAKAQPYVKQLNADFVVSGHDHNFQVFEDSGIPYYIMGSGGKVDTQQTNTARLPPSVPNKYFYPWRNVGSNIGFVCSAPNTSAFAPFCPRGRIVISTAIFGGANTSSCGDSNCSAFTVTSFTGTFGVTCNNQQNCVINATKIAALEKQRNCTGGYLTVIWFCAESSLGTFSAVSAGENDMYVHTYASDGTLLYEKVFNKPISAELPPPPPIPPPVPVPVASPVAPPTATPSTTPSAPPSSSPVAPPTATPSAPPSTAPVAPPTATPSAPPSSSPITPPSTNPVAPPSSSPVAPPSANPVSPPGSQPTDSGSSNVGLIVGLCIGLFILMAIVLGAVYWYANKSNNDWEPV